MSLDTSPSHATMIPESQMVHKCNECEKRFHSEKAVHGHMRMHSETKNHRIKAKKRVKKVQTKYDMVHETNNEKEEEENEVFNEEFVEDLYEIFDCDAEEIIAAYSIFHLKNNVNAAENEDTEVKLYQCDECNKSFESYQALGGHVSSHSKLKNVESGAKNEKSGPTEPRNGRDPKEHRCSICGMTFDSGQKLGGHKSGHFYERERLKASLNIVPSSSSSSSKRSECTVPMPSTATTPSFENRSNTKDVYVFDLNVLPKIDDDAEDNGAI